MIGRLRVRLSNPIGLILLYHRVSAGEPDPQLLAVSRTHFNEHLEVLGRTARPSRLAEMTSETDSPEGVAITFDDGYADNLHEALPLLSAHGHPATVFVTAGHVQTGAPFWWDEVQNIVLESGPATSNLTLDLGDGSHRWELGSDGAAPDSSWHVESPAATSRQQAYMEICRLLRPLPATARQEALDQLRSRVAVGPHPATTGRPLAPEELATLGKDPLIEIGSHSMTHPVLSRQSEAVQRDEVSRSKSALEDMIGREVSSFAYPFGGRADYTARTIDAVRSAGYRRACSNFAGRPRARTSPYELPRMLVRDWGGGEFARRLGLAQRA
jgi:peptidoglycan/xylan/chitin deacetylase (PgdA/CDA1 family)